MLIIKIKDMDDSTITSYTISVNTKSKQKTIDVMMLTKVTKIHESGVHFPVIFFLRTGLPYDEPANSFRGYVALQCRIKFSILKDSWHDIGDEFKDKLSIHITVFIFTSIYDLFFNLIIIWTLLCKHRKCLLF